MMKSVRCPGCRLYVDIPAFTQPGTISLYIPCICGGTVIVPICQICKGKDYIGNDPCKCNGGASLPINFREPLENTIHKISDQPVFGDKIPPKKGRMKLSQGRG